MRRPSFDPSLMTPAVARRRRLALPVTLAAAMVASLALAAPAAPASAATTVTKYAYSATGFGTKVTAEDAEMRSGMTAYSLIGCTKAAGVHNANTASASDLNDQVRVGNVRTDQRSLVNAAGTSMVESVTNVASIEVGDDSLGFRITGLQGISRAYATKGDKLNAASTFTFSDLQPLGGTTLPPPLDQPADVILDELANGPVTVPGLGVIKLGQVAKAVSTQVARSGSIGMEIHMFGQDGANGGTDDSDVLIGRSYARINRAATHGVFSGGAWGTDGTMGDGSVVLGRNPFSPMSCEGTRGQVRSTSLSNLNLVSLNQLLLGTVVNRVYGVQNTPAGGATGWVESSSSSLNMGGGALQMSDVLARAKVIRSSTNRYYPTAVQRIGSITANGEPQPVPAPGETLTIPGVATIEVPLPVRTTRGISVVGAKVTLLGGSAVGSVINVASAKLELRAY
jgi:hypothetical protein